MCGILDISAYSIICYILMTISTGIHLTLVGIASTRQKGSVMFTVLFGMLGPGLAIHCLVYLAFLVTGWMSIFMSNTAVHLAAKRYRVWCRISRIFALSWLITTSTFLMSCYSFRQGMSIYEHTKDYIRHRRTQRLYKGTYEREILGMARWIDNLDKANPSASLMFPYDFFMFCGYNLGVSISFLLLLPFLYILSFLWGQERYYRWRFFPNTKVPIE